MLVIRMQRSGRKGHAMFRVVVQDSRRTPTSGKLVAQLGSYDPHAKTIIVDKDKAQFYLDHGAQPSERVARLFGSEGIKLPNWVLTPDAKKRTVRNADKRRSTRPEVPVEKTAEKPEAEVQETASLAESVEETTEATEEKSVEKPEIETSAEAENTTPEALTETEEPEASPAIESVEETTKVEAKAEKKAKPKR
jgi:small subunit ribosomal protein S16